jgi:hypothetical protein
MKPNTDLLRAKIFHGLKSLQCTGDRLQPRFMEIAICESFGCQHVGDSAYYADGVTADTQVSVKTRSLVPVVMTRQLGRDFQSHPEKFLGPQVNKKQNRWTYGLEIVQRRQQLDLENDSTADPVIVGQKTLDGFQRNIDDSTTKYNTSNTYEIIGVHGYDRTEKFYIVSVFWKEHEPLDHHSIQWRREGSGVSGYINDNGVMKKICERVNGNAKREATCFKEYKDLTKYTEFVNIKVPIPEPWNFDQHAILTEINLKEQSHADTFFLSQ